MFIDLSADALKLKYLFIGKGLDGLLAGSYLLFFRTAGRKGINSHFFGRYLFIGDRSITHLVIIGIHQAGDHGLTKPKACINR